MTRMIIGGILGFLLLIHGSAVVSWAGAREFRDWNFYMHATLGEWIEHHTLYIPGILLSALVGAAIVLISIRRVG